MREKRILWLDNEPRLVRHFARSLKDRGLHVDLVKTISDFAEHWDGGEYDMVILDVMIPTVSDDEERRYGQGETQGGTCTGLEVFRRYRDDFRKMGVHVLVFTVRFDPDIRRRFLEEGLGNTSFKRKGTLRNVEKFMQWIMGYFDETQEDLNGSKLGK